MLCGKKKQSKSDSHESVDCVVKLMTEQDAPVFIYRKKNFERRKGKQLESSLKAFQNQANHTGMCTSTSLLSDKRSMPASERGIFSWGRQQTFLGSSVSTDVMRSGSTDCLNDSK